MANIKLDTVRSGVKVLSGLLKKADFEGNESGRVSRTELRNFIDSYGDGGSLDAALSKVYSYAKARFKTDAPTVSELNKALADAMKGVARGDTNDNKSISATERRALASTWKAVADFAQEYKGMSVGDIMYPRGAP